MNARSCAVMNSSHLTTLQAIVGSAFNFYDILGSGTTPSSCVSLKYISSAFLILVAAAVRIEFRTV